MSLKRRLAKLEAAAKARPAPAEVPSDSDESAWQAFCRRDPWARRVGAKLSARCRTVWPDRAPSNREMFDDPECWALLERLHGRFREEQSEEVQRIRSTGEPPNLSDPTNVRHCSFPNRVWRLLLWASVRGLDTSTIEGCREVLKVHRRERAASYEWSSTSPGSWARNPDACEWLATTLLERAKEEALLSGSDSSGRYRSTEASVSPSSGSSA